MNRLLRNTNQLMNRCWTAAGECVSTVWHKLTDFDQKQSVSQRDVFSMLFFTDVCSPNTWPTSWHITCMNTGLNPRPLCFLICVTPQHLRFIHNNEFKFTKRQRFKHELNFCQKIFLLSDWLMNVWTVSCIHSASVPTLWHLRSVKLWARPFKPHLLHASK